MFCLLRMFSNHKKFFLKTNDGGVCTRCRADSRTLKIYSAGNNMVPGPVPSELSVSFLICSV